MSMKRAELIGQIKKKKSMLCVGLDPKMDSIPAAHLKEEDPQLAFLKQVISETADHCVAYKPNLAFFESDGVEGMRRFAQLMDHLKASHPDHLIIADAKRGDIGHTAERYAKAYFDTFSCDALTLSPYMGMDTLAPFSGREGKWMVALGLTSNPGSEDLELLELKSGKRLYEEAMDRMARRFGPDELMFVVGATRPEMLASIRQRCPEHFFLVPGVGAQGGSVDEVCRNAATAEGGLLINASRSILYPGSDSADSHKEAAAHLQEQMAPYINS